MINLFKELATSAAEHGWELLLVGGAVRDHLMGSREFKDLDCEMFGSYTNAELEEWLSTIGEWAMDPNGKFPVYRLQYEGTEIEISIPRKDNWTGVYDHYHGHTPEPDGMLSYAEAALRRDFRFNAASYRYNANEDVLELVDPYDALLSIHHEELDPVDAETFIQDPSRFDRGMQFACRTGFEASGLLSILGYQYREQMAATKTTTRWGEWYKALTKGRYWIELFQYLIDTGMIGLFSALDDLIGCPQEPEHHPEGDAYAHTVLVTQAMSDILDREGIEGDDRIVPMLAAICHDMGKAETTFLGYKDDLDVWHFDRADMTIVGYNTAQRLCRGAEYDQMAGAIVSQGKIRSYGHDQETSAAEGFLDQIGCPKDIKQQVIGLIKTHMRHVSFHTGGNISGATVRRLARDLDACNTGIEAWALVVEADHSGRPPLPGGLPEPAQTILEMAREMGVNEHRPEPIVMGRHLLPRGWTPGRHIGDTLDKLYELQLEGVFDDLNSGLRQLATLEKMGWKA